MSVFDDVVGQPGVVARLREAVADSATGGRAFTHSWLFTGPPGSGRSVAARAFAAALQCPDGGCGHCQACHLVLAGTHPDVTVVVPEGLSIGVDEARAIVRSSGLAPTIGGWHLVVIEDADRLTEASANALLKAIEEPPKHAVFLLCAPSVDDLLPTVRSRCRLVPLGTPPAAAVADVLVRRDGVDPAMAAFAARAAQGHIGRAKRLALDEEARHQRRDVLTLPAALTSLEACLAAADVLVKASTEEAERVTAPLERAETESLQRALGEGATGKVKVRASAGVMKDLEKRQKSRGTRQKRDSLDRALTDLAAFYRDVLMVQTASAVEMVHVDLRDQVTAVARSSAPAQTLRRIEAVLACRERIAANVAPLLAVEEMAVRLARA